MEKYQNKPIILIIAGVDPSGGAGILADIRTVSNYSLYTFGCVTCITSQTPKQLFAVKEIDADFLYSQIIEPIKIAKVSAVKIGLISNDKQVDKINEAFELLPADCFVVIDPVMVASAGGQLNPQFPHEKFFAIKAKNKIITPNLKEAEKLSNLKIETYSDMQKACEYIYEKSSAMTLIKGAKFSENMVDLFFDGHEFYKFENKIQKLKKFESHGTGCMLSSSIAANLASDRNVPKAIEMSINQVQKALANRLFYNNGFVALNQMV